MKFTKIALLGLHSLALAQAAKPFPDVPTALAAVSAAATKLGKDIVSLTGDSGLPTIAKDVTALNDTLSSAIPILAPTLSTSESRCCLHPP